MKLDNENIFAEIERVINESLDITQRVSQKMKDESPYAKQRRSDYDKGLVRLGGGIVVYLRHIQHRILFDGFECQILQVFVDLCRNVLKEKNTSLVQFSLRTVLEMSFRKICILFSETISERDKQKYKALILLADYGYMTEHGSDYNKLLSDFESYFTYKQINLLKSLRVSVLRGEEREGLVKKVRKLIDSTQDSLHQRVVVPSLFKEKRIESITSTLSHILHGDFILVSSLFIEGREKANILRITTVLMYASLNSAIAVESEIVNADDSTLLDSLKKDVAEIINYLGKNWRTLQK